MASTAHSYSHGKTARRNAFVWEDFGARTKQAERMMQPFVHVGVITWCLIFLMNYQTL